LEQNQWSYVGRQVSPWYYGTDELVRPTLGLFFSNFPSSVIVRLYVSSCCGLKLNMMVRLGLNMMVQICCLIMLQLMTEKGNHIKIRRQLEQVMSEQTQLVADSAHLRESAAELASDAESFAARELELKMAADRLAAELRAASADRDRLTRELEDKQVRGAAIQDNIKVCTVARYSCRHNCRSLVTVCNC